MRILLYSGKGGVGKTSVAAATGIDLARRCRSPPAALCWYGQQGVTLERRLLEAVRPLANRVAPVEMPPDAYFDKIRDLVGKVEGIDTVLENASITSVRLVTNAEKMVLRETQRAYVYFSLHGLTVDRIIVNRLFPVELHDEFFDKWRELQWH